MEAPNMKEKKTNKTVNMPKTRKRIIRQRMLPETLPELKALTPETIKKTILGIQKSIRENYVFPEQTEALCHALETHHANNDYDQITDPRVFCEQLTQHLRNVVYDKHLQVMLPKDVPDMISRGMRKSGKGSKGAYLDVDKVEILPDNIGYVNINMFNMLCDSRDKLEGAMQFVKNTDALILDLRKCRGGSADSVNFLLSYFFDSKTPITLLKTYFRPRNKTVLSQTTRTPFKYEKPIYALTSGFTFSAGEHFLFALKVHKKATLVGTNTGGGAHPVAIIALDTGILFKVPIGRTYDPETNIDWEGTGVTPDIRCPEADALDGARKDIRNRLAA